MQMPETSISKMVGCLDGLPWLWFSHIIPGVKFHAAVSLQVIWNSAYQKHHMLLPKNLVILRFPTSRYCTGSLDQ